LTRVPDDLVFVDELAVRGRAERIAAWSITAARIPTPDLPLPSAVTEPARPSVTGTQHVAE
jgi:hypothetical protein